MLNWRFGLPLVTVLDVLLRHHILNRRDALQRGLLSLSQVEKGDHLVSRVGLLRVCDSSENVEKILVDSLIFSVGNFSTREKFVLFADGASLGDVWSGERRHKLINLADICWTLDLKNWRYLIISQNESISLRNITLLRNDARWLGESE